MTEILAKFIKSKPLIDEIFSKFEDKINIIKTVDKFSTDSLPLKDSQLCIYTTVRGALELYDEFPKEKSKRLTAQKIFSLIDIWLEYHNNNCDRPEYHFGDLFKATHHDIKEIKTNKLNSFRKFFHSLSHQRKDKLLYIIFGLITQFDLEDAIFNYLESISIEAA